jgi:hypothetical protein
MGLPGTVLITDSASRPGVLPALRTAVLGERSRDADRRSLQSGVKTFGLILPVEAEKMRSTGAFKQRWVTHGQS